jgi:hypothetical protein
VVYFVWNTEKFRPERSLSPDGKSLEKKKGQVRLVCHTVFVGEAHLPWRDPRSCRILFLTSVFQAFRIELSPKIAPSEVENAPSFSRFTLALVVAFKERIALFFETIIFYALEQKFRYMILNQCQSQFASFILIHCIMEWKMDNGKNVIWKELEFHET